MAVASRLDRAAPPGFLDPATLARIDNLELLARTVVDGFINGLHRSPYLGLSLDFAEHRPYNPGDDVRRIDWRLYARTDRYYVKEFEADTNANFTVLLDVSASMNYAGAGDRGLSKLDYGRYLAACLTYFSNQQRDRVGLVTFDHDIVDYVPNSARHLDIVLHTLDRIDPASETSANGVSGADGGRVPGEAGSSGAPRAGVSTTPAPRGLAAAINHVAEHIKRRGVVVLMSDFYEDPEAAVHAVRQLRHRGNDVIVFHLLDPTEVEFPFDEATHFQDLETGERIPVVPETMREKYRQLIDAHIARLARLFTEERIDYSLFDTGTPLDYALFRYLSDRERLSRVR